MPSDRPLGASPRLAGLVHDVLLRNAASEARRAKSYAEGAARVPGFRTRLLGVVGAGAARSQVYLAEFGAGELDARRVLAGVAAVREQHPSRL